MYIWGWIAAIAIEFIFLALINEIYIWGVIVITFGLLFLACLFHGDAASKIGVIVMAIYCIIWGVLLVLEPVARERLSWGKRYGGLIFAEGMGLVFFLLGIYTSLIKLITCTEKIVAVYVGAEPCRVQRHVKYTPKFSFKRNGKTYCNATGHAYSGRKLSRKFKEGKGYRIYINPKNPYNIVENRRIEGSSLVLLVMGIGFMLIPFCG